MHLIMIFFLPLLISMTCQPVAHISSRKYHDLNIYIMEWEILFCAHAK